MGRNLSHSNKYCPPLKSSDEKMEGLLLRKHEWINTTKKASNRSWNRVHAVVKEHKIFFYKDQKTYKENVTFKGEAALDLLNGTADIAHDYTKKLHVFRLRLADGGEYLFQALDEVHMKLWISVINNQTNHTDTYEPKSQTLPPSYEKSTNYWNKGKLKKNVSS